MTPIDARKILGLSPTEDPRPFLAEFRNAREHIAAMVKSAPNETLAGRYQKGLNEFDEALAVIQEEISPGEKTSPPPAITEEKVIPPPAKTVVLGTVPPPSKPATVIESEVTEEEGENSPSRALSFIVWFFVIFIGAAGGAWLYVKNEQFKEEQRTIRVVFLERQGSIFIENRRWQEAADMFKEIETLTPGSEIARRGRRSIEAGMVDEQTQFLGYWNGQATAELEAGRLDEADAAARKVLARFPADKEATGLLERIATARVTQSQDAALAAARDALNQRKWELAISTSRKILAASPDDPDAKSILADATAAMSKAAANKEKAAGLLKMASARDQGQFDQQALDWIREASSLAPDDKEIASLLEKLSGYTRTLRVPGDFSTPEEALANARDRDRIVLGAETWKGPLVINAAVELQGAGSGNTKIECPPDSGSAITIGPDAKGARVSGISFRHNAFAVGTDRFSAALVRGGKAAFVDCNFTEASGHGLAVIEGGQATISHCHFSNNGWDGIAAIGNGSTLEVRDSESLDNFEHGIESWDGAAVILVNNRCEGNSRNGIHADNGLASATIEGNQLIANREFGIVLDSAAAGKVSGNTARANLLGGIVIRAAAKVVSVATNEATLNKGPGLILEKGLVPASYASNSVSKNTGEQILTGVNLSSHDDSTPAPGEKIPRATIIVEPAPDKKR
ncbi:MAG: right-handed parallel beta-helix repeat-containing protein [Luteolibacter sp.]|uniref:right-handed parallel beta-helix repeat-containing protein n=1 Tax=Luteolibacter sp. TaxID=1962973 RepID=UPI00326636F2